MEDKTFSYPLGITENSENPIMVEAGGYKFVKLKTESDDDNFYHALLNCIYLDYQNSDDIDYKKDIIKNFKKELIIEFIKEDENYTDLEVFNKIKKNFLELDIYIESLNGKILEATINKKYIFDEEEKRLFKNNSKFFTLNNFKSVFILFEDNIKKYSLLKFLENIKNRNIKNTNVFEANLTYLISKILNVNIIQLHMWNNNVTLEQSYYEKINQKGYRINVYDSNNKDKVNDGKYTKPSFSDDNFIILFKIPHYYDVDLKENESIIYETGGIINNKSIQTNFPTKYLSNILKLDLDGKLILQYLTNFSIEELNQKQTKVDNKKMIEEVTKEFYGKNDQFDFFEEDYIDDNSSFYLNTEPLLSDISQIDFSFSKERSENIENSIPQELPYWLEELEDKDLEDEFKDEGVKITNKNRLLYKNKLLDRLG